MTNDPRTTCNEETFAEIATLAAKRKYRSFTLRLAIMKPNHFVTGCLTFRPEAVHDSEQEIRNYSDIVLASFTCDIDMWQDFARRLSAGRLEVDGAQIPAQMTYSNRQEELYLDEGASIPRDCFFFRNNDDSHLYSTKPIVGIGQQPYANLADASARYVHHSETTFHGIPHEKCLVVVLPLANRIRMAEWLPQHLRVRLSDSSLPGYQFDFLFWQQQNARVRSSHSISDLTSEIDVSVPEQTSTIVGYLVAPTGDIVQSFVLNSPYSFVGEEQCSLSLEQQIRADILAGESENREMKTFFNPDNNQPMRDRVLDSAIAFANTNGGHIYIGVEDHGQLSGNAKLLRTSTDRSLTPEKAARELSAKVRKHLIENIRPVVDIRASEICIASDWVIRLTIESSQQIVSDHANHVLIRSGASNRIPDPSWHGDRRLVHPALPF